jgi:hypothetical protein
MQGRIPLCGIAVEEEENRIVGPVYQPGEPHSDRLTIETGKAQIEMYSYSNYSWAYRQTDSR